MSGFLNRVQLIGNLGRDPEVRTMQSGGRVVTLSIATSESWKDERSGERRERTEWHRVVILALGVFLRRIPICSAAVPSNSSGTPVAGQAIAQQPQSVRPNHIDQPIRTGQATAHAKGTDSNVRQC